LSPPLEVHEDAQARAKEILDAGVAIGPGRLLAHPSRDACWAEPVPG
jgi:hypothetical protein